MSAPATLLAPPARPSRIAKTMVLAAIAVVAGFFVARFALYYALHYNQRAYSMRGLHYWRDRFWLLPHIAGGTVALLTGPLQFSRRLRQWSPRFHRLLGRSYLIAVLVAGLASLYMSIFTAEQWGFGVALFTLGLAWLTCSGMAFYAIRRRQIQIHKEWMVRSYIVTFAFVTFRYLIFFPPFNRLPERHVVLAVMGFACWVLPMGVAEVWMQLRAMRHSAPRRPVYAKSL